MGNLNKFKNMQCSRVFTAIGVVLVTVSLSACDLVKQYMKDKDKAVVTGTKTVHKITVDGLKREFIVYVPKSAEGIEAPVVFMLHGTSGDGQKFYSISYWQEKSDESGMISVFPSALTHCFFEDGAKTVTTKWANGELGDPADSPELPLCNADQIAAIENETLRAAADHPLADDLAFFDNMLAFLQNNYTIDNKRVYVSGFSNGGSMSARLGVERSEVFAATASAAAIVRVSGHPTRPISMVVSFGNMDDRFLPKDGSLTAYSMDVNIGNDPLFDTTFGRYMDDLQLSHNHTSQEVWAECGNADCVAHANQSKCVNTANCIKLIKVTYGESLIGASNKLHIFMIDQATHEYPNGTNHPLIMAEYLWDEFFVNHKLP